MKKVASSVILFFLFSASVFAQDIAPDGQIKILPFEPTHVKDMEGLTKDIKDFHKLIEGFLSFLNKRKKIINNEYFQFVPASELVEFPSREKYLFDKKFYLKVSGGQGALKLEGIRFITRKSLVTKLRPVNEEIGELKNENIPASDPASIVLLVQKKTDAGTQEESYNLSNIRNPNQRVKLVRSYRNNLAEVVQAIGKYVEGTIQADRNDVDTMLEGLDQGGSFQEFQSK
ncbi:hypothetical protein LEP1GSC047_3650 [Leptospira inadai serovar Lyme str. 10]|uniref:Uncharacterized protein n=2 Tax=Leptospira inadai serovar Lyme TaxID=293084 RepID=V6HC20_9LEPT|nr:hypothetical protein [Leptospira inadai]EQA37326.1 hypothetical protein LEP1GSC047_3650 [Leptospira inadai serovar Lyme str. 10]PNV75004.1 hypothetical protein BES34_010555 [Leptospira inadai serovar Lyme]